ncbi:MAG: hypothetical protein ACI4HQ_12310 [Acetatifactor sp.]
MLERIYGFIPRRIGNRTLLAAWELLRKRERLCRKDFSGNLKKNEVAFPKHEATICGNKGYVEDQNSYGDMAYGKTTMKNAGCEIFAAYNAIHSVLGQPFMSLSEMIGEFEKDGMTLGGKFGTTPKAVRDFLQRKGFETELVTREERFEELGQKSQSLILTMYNDKSDIRAEIHTVNISKEPAGYVAHNVYCNGRVEGPYESIREMMEKINGGQSKAICLIGIK